MIIFYILVVISLSMSFLVETSSWCARSYAGKGNIGIFIARTNIYLYGGRFFAIASQVLIGYLVDSGAVPIQTLGIFFFGFVLSVLTHFVILGNRSWRYGFEKKLLFLLQLKSDRQADSISFPINQALFWATSVVSTFFAIALMAPLVLASAFPEYRLTLNNSGSLINFFGMLLLLGYLDPMMYKSLDDDTFNQKIESYIWGRMTGFAVCATLLALVLIGLTWL